MVSVSPSLFSCQLPGVNFEVVRLTGMVTSGQGFTILGSGVVAVMVFQMTLSNQRNYDVLPSDA